MSNSVQTVFAVTLLVVSSLIGAGIMYAVTGEMSTLAFVGWVIFFAALQFTMLPSYKSGSCRIMDWFLSQK